MSPFVPTRRAVLAGGFAALAAAPALAAPSPADASAWIDYEARLRARLADAGGGRFDEAAAAEVLALTNRVRAEAGVSPVAWHDELADAARAHAADLAHRRYIEHLSPEKFDPSHRFWLLGRRTIGSPSENIAYHRGGAAHATPDQLLRIWRGSPQHWKNLLRPTHTHAAFGLARAGDRDYLVGLYARPAARMGEPLPFRPTEEAFARALRSIPAAHKPGVSTPQGTRWARADGPPVVCRSRSNGLWTRERTS